MLLSFESNYERGLSAAGEKLHSGACKFSRRRKVRVHSSIQTTVSSMVEPAGPAFPDRAAHWIAVLTCNSETLSCQKIVFVSSDFTEQEAVRVSQTEVIG